MLQALKSWIFFVPKKVKSEVVSPELFQKGGKLPEHRLWLIIRVVGFRWVSLKFDEFCCMKGGILKCGKHPGGCSACPRGGWSRAGGDPWQFFVSDKRLFVANPMLP